MQASCNKNEYEEKQAKPRGSGPWAGEIVIGNRQFVVQRGPLRVLFLFLLYLFPALWVIIFYLFSLALVRDPDSPLRQGFPRPLPLSMQQRRLERSANEKNRKNIVGINCSSTICAALHEIGKTVNVCQVSHESIASYPTTACSRARRRSPSILPESPSPLACTCNWQCLYIQCMQSTYSAANPHPLATLPKGPRVRPNGQNEETRLTTYIPLLGTNIDLGGLTMGKRKGALPF